MNITLYNNLSPSDYLNKNLTDATTRACELIYPLDINNPSLKLRYDNNFSFNYAHLNADGIDRYYYIDKKTVENSAIILTLVQDDLYTFRADILNATGLITRSHKGNRFINDNLATVTNQTAWKFRTLGTAFRRSEVYNHIFIKGGK